MKNILDAPFITEIKRTASNMYRLGWDERNAGNISVLLDKEEAASYLNLNEVIREIPLNFETVELAGKVFLVTGTGKFFKNIEHDPELNLGIMHISKDGKTAQLLWGYSDGGKFTSEFPSHLMCHVSRMKINPQNRVIMHSHPTNLVAMTYVHKLDEKDFSNTLWQLCIEAILVFPEGIGILPWMLCGTNEIGEATAKKMSEYKLVMWAMHGVFGSGKDLDETFGLIETAEKAAEIFIKTTGMSIINTTTNEQIKCLADYWKINYRKDWLL